MRRPPPSPFCVSLCLLFLGFRNKNFKKIKTNKKISPSSVAARPRSHVSGMGGGERKRAKKDVRLVMATTEAVNLSARKGRAAPSVGGNDADGATETAETTLVLTLQNEVTALRAVLRRVESRVAEVEKKVSRGDGRSVHYGRSNSCCATMAEWCCFGILLIVAILIGISIVATYLFKPAY